MRVCGRLLLFGCLWLGSSVVMQVSARSYDFQFYTEDYPPFSFNYRGEITGINTELLQAVVKDLGYGANFEIVPWGRAQRFTQTQPDTCFFSAARIPEREGVYQWVGPLSRERVQLFSLDPNHPRYEHFSEARGYRIGGQSADAYTDWGVGQGIEVQRVMEIPTNLDLLRANRIDLWLAGSVGGPFIAKQFNLALYPVVSSQQVFELWLACNVEVPEDAIINLNNTLHRMQLDGTLDQIMERYR